VIFEVSSNIGRHFWQRPRVAMEAEGCERLPAVFGFGPAEQSQARELFDALRHAVDHELTDRQRQVFVANRRDLAAPPKLFEPLRYLLVVVQESAVRIWQVDSVDKLESPPGHLVSNQVVG
jgi:hypothetical protein